MRFQESPSFRVE